MDNTSASLAKSITFSGSKQSYYTARLLVDRDLVDDCYRAYAYFRWADDVVDDLSLPKSDRVAFIRRQQELIDNLYKGNRVQDLAPEEKIIADLIQHDCNGNDGLQSFIRNFLAAIEFDLYRNGRLISEDELTWYSVSVGTAVTDAIQYFIGNGHRYPNSRDQYMAATAAHISHMLRDMRVDLEDGYFNIPVEYLEANGLQQSDLEFTKLQDFVRERVWLAREYFKRGKQYLDQLNVLRCKIAGYWYCARFERILDNIERDDYLLRLEYKKPNRALTWLKYGWLAVLVTIQHSTGR